MIPIIVLYSWWINRPENYNMYLYILIICLGLMYVLILGNIYLDGMFITYISIYITVIIQAAITIVDYENTGRYDNAILIPFVLGLVLTFITCVTSITQMLS